MKLDIRKALGIVTAEDIAGYEQEVNAANDMLMSGTGKGNDFLGWVHLPSSITRDELATLK